MSNKDVRSKVGETIMDVVDAVLDRKAPFATVILNIPALNGRPARMIQVDVSDISETPVGFVVTGLGGLGADPSRN